jgi:hypothetical protein
MEDAFSLRIVELNKEIVILKEKVRIAEETFDLIVDHPVKPGFNLALYLVQIAKGGLGRMRKVGE